MYPKGVVYKNNYKQLKGEVSIHASNRIKIIYSIIRIFASSVITFSVVMIVFSFWPIVKELIIFRNSSKEKISRFGDIVEVVKAQSSQRSKEEIINLNLDPYFSIYIPKINAKANIVANVDPNSEKEYLNALKLGVAHAKGTGFPGQGRLVYLFSHSTDSPINILRYSAVFFLLKKLETGDRIEVFFLNKKYVYQVMEKKVVKSDDVSWLQESNSEEKLILQTCDPPGTSINRLIVIAKPI